MENQGLLVGRMTEAPRAEENASKTRYNAVFNVQDLEGNVYSSLKAYGYTADELFNNAGAGQCVALHYSLSLRTQQQSQTGESIFALFIRSVGMSADPSYIERIGVNNKITIEGTLVEAPAIRQEGNQQVAYIKLEVVRRNLALAVEKNGSSEIITLAVRNQGDINTLNYCGQGAKICVTGKIAPIPGNYTVMLQVQTVEVFSFRAQQVVNNMSAQQNTFNNNTTPQQNTFNNITSPQQNMMAGNSNLQSNNTLNTVEANTKPNSGILRYINNQIVDANGTVYDYSQIPGGCHTLDINGQTFITNANGQFINSNGDILDQNGQITSEYNSPQGVVNNTPQPQNNSMESQNSNSNTIGFKPSNQPQMDNVASQAQGFGNSGQMNNDTPQTQGFGNSTQMNNTAPQTQGFGNGVQMNNTAPQTQGFGNGVQMNNTAPQTQGFGNSTQMNNTAPQGQGFGNGVQMNNTAPQTQGFGNGVQMNNTAPQTQGFGNSTQMNNTAPQTQGFGNSGQMNTATPQGQAFGNNGQMNNTTPQGQGFGN